MRGRVRRLRPGSGLGIDFSDERERAVIPTARLRSAGRIPPDDAALRAFREVARVHRALRRGGDFPSAREANAHRMQQPPEALAIRTPAQIRARPDRALCRLQKEALAEGKHSPQQAAQGLPVSRQRPALRCAPRIAVVGLAENGPLHLVVGIGHGPALFLREFLIPRRKRFRRRHLCARPPPQREDPAEPERADQEAPANQPAQFPRGLRHGLRIHGREIRGIDKMEHAQRDERHGHKHPSEKIRAHCEEQQEREKDDRRDLHEPQRPPRGVFEIRHRNGCALRRTRHGETAHARARRRVRRHLLGRPARREVGEGRREFLVVRRGARELFRLGVGQLEQQGLAGLGEDAADIVGQRAAIGKVRGLVQIIDHHIRHRVVVPVREKRRDESGEPVVHQRGPVMHARDGLHMLGGGQFVQVAKAGQLRPQRPAHMVDDLPFFVVRGGPDQDRPAARRPHQIRQRNARDDADDIAPEKPRENERIVEDPRLDIDLAGLKRVLLNFHDPAHFFLPRDHVPRPADALETVVGDNGLRLLAVLHEVQLKLEQRRLGNRIRQRDHAAVQRLHRAVRLPRRDERATTRDRRFQVLVRGHGLRRILRAGHLALPRLRLVERLGFRGDQLAPLRQLLFKIPAGFLLVENAHRSRQIQMHPKLEALQLQAADQVGPQRPPHAQADDQLIARDGRVALGDELARAIDDEGVQVRDIRLRGFLNLEHIQAHRIGVIGSAARRRAGVKQQRGGEQAGGVKGGIFSHNDAVKKRW